ncbi:adenylate/guanylate cyclase domain-containing protein [Nordella sp. HKS 07]|uniref:adenylate/guanylate cyclase domain-containing protein n=1 Tax=Nordella sp. HKS 07 TaxID=2712222 RepID=UPI0013E0EB66|nr:adenylate/guanylate cyclase domain-containing protein [Nordella sp. HKS 07]QIG48150.1 adenylate/guanylate cyclase domain-containing protein [Nordella sp. HKS 07]
MKDAEIERISAAIIARGLGGQSEIELLQGFCADCNAAGLDLAMGIAVIDTLHPIHEGRAFHWRADGQVEREVTEYTPTSYSDENWRQSIFYHLMQTGGDELRRRIDDGTPRDFDFLNKLEEQNQTDYVAFLQRFDREGVIGEMDCIYTHWSTGKVQGFDDAELAALRRLVPLLALALKTSSVTRVAETIAEVYLGRDAGARVLKGRIVRGVADRINAVLWYSDLKDFTTITDAAPPDEVIPLLNDYADAVISAIHDKGGDVLKLIGDGVLAIFGGAEPAETCRRALLAEAKMRKRIADLNDKRKAEGRPLAGVNLGLHIGDVFYGNIGSTTRLDFTVIGPAVNEVSRIVALCRSVDRDNLFSSDFVAATPEPERSRLVSVGRFALRGVSRAQDLYTIDPELVRG